MREVLLSQKMWSPILHAPLLSAILRPKYRSEPLDALLVAVFFFFFVYRSLLRDETSISF